MLHSYSYSYAREGSGRSGLQVAGALDGKRSSRPSPRTHSASACAGLHVWLLQRPSSPQRADCGLLAVSFAPPTLEADPGPDLVAGRGAWGTGGEEEAGGGGSTR